MRPEQGGGVFEAHTLAGFAGRGEGSAEAFADAGRCAHNAVSEKERGSRKDGRQGRKQNEKRKRKDARPGPGG